MAPEPVGGGEFVTGQFAGQEAVAVAGEHGEGGVQVDVQRQPGGQGVEVETGDVGVEFVLDDHPFGVAGEQVFGWRGEVVGDQQGGLVVADVADGDLAQGVVDAFEVDDLFVYLGVAVTPGAFDVVSPPRAGRSG